MALGTTGCGSVPPNGRRYCNIAIRIFFRFSRIENVDALFVSAYGLSGVLLKSCEVKVCRFAGWSAYVDVGDMPPGVAFFVPCNATPFPSADIKAMALVEVAMFCVVVGFAIALIRSIAEGPPELVLMLLLSDVPSLFLGGLDDAVVVAVGVGGK